MTASSKQQYKSAREAEITDREAGFALNGLLRIARKLGDADEAKLLKDVAKNLRDLMIHELDLPETEINEKGCIKMDKTSRATVSTHALQKHYATKDALERQEAVLMVMNHVACQDEFRDIFKENAADCFIKVSTFHRFCNRAPENNIAPVYIRVAHEKTKLVEIFSKKAETSALKDIVAETKELFYEGESPDPFSEALAINDDADSDYNNVTEIIGTFRKSLHEFMDRTYDSWDEIRKAHPVTDNPHILKAS